jgi:hypothetical protein
MGRRVYGRAMMAMSLLRFLSLIALILAPIGMMSGHAAIAMSAVSAGAHHMDEMASPDHCAGMDQPSKNSSQTSVDCTFACSVLPAAETEIGAHPLAASSAPYARPNQAVHSLHPESDPPPPRYA